MTDLEYIGVVVVSYRSPERTAAFVKEQLTKLPFKYRICVVDVASTTENRLALGELLPPETGRLFCEENLGYSRGNNRGARKLREEVGGLKYLFICNDDVLFDEESHLERMVDYLDEHPDCGIVGPSVVGTDGLEQSPWDTADDLGAHERYHKWEAPFGGESRKCYAVRGCALMIRADAFFDVGGFDEEYFLFFEEPVLGEKFTKIGLYTWYLAESHVTHLGSATIKKELASWKIYKLYRESFMRTAIKYWKWGWLRRITWPLRHAIAKFFQRD